MDLVLLNYDILPEIFGYLAAIDHAAPYTIMLVCQAWQEVVLRTPEAWSHILIDDGIPNIEAKCERSLTLSRNKPLVVTVRLPIKSILPIKGAMARISLLILDVHCSLSDRGAMNMAIRLLQEYRGLVSYKGPVQWQRNGSNILLPSEDFYMELGSGGPSSLLDNPNQKHWPILFTDLSITRPLPIWSSMSFSSLTKLIYDLKNLGRLQLYSEYLGKVLSIHPPHSFSLCHLKQIYLRFDSNAEQVQALIELLAAIEAPDIEDIYLDGPFYDIATAIGLLKPSLCPVTLTLHIAGAVEHRLVKCDTTMLLHRLRTLVIQPYDNLGCSRLSSYLQGFLLMVPNLSSCHFILDDYDHDIKPIPWFLTCAIDLTYQIRGCMDRDRLELKAAADIHLIRNFSLLVADYFLTKEFVPSFFTFPGDSRREKQHPQSHNIFSAVDILAQRIEVPQPKEGYSMAISHPKSEEIYGQSRSYSRNSPLHRIKKLVIRPLNDRSMATVNLAQLPTDIQTLEVDRCYFSRSMLSDGALICSSFGVLTTIIAPTQSVAYLIKWNLVPALRDFTVSLPFGLQNEDIADRLIQAVIEYGYRYGSTIRTVGFKYHPPWPSCIQLLRYLYLSQEESMPQRDPIDPTVVLRLPSLPHPAVLQQLVKALRGENAEMPITQPARPSYSEYQSHSAVRARGCYYCLASGWNCTSRPNHVCAHRRSCRNADNLFCERHSETELVSITQYTI